MLDDLAGGDRGWRPNLFVPGFPKCGTTALCDYLRQHPDIYIIEPKEPNTLAIGIEYPSWRKKHNRVMRPYSAYMNPGRYRKEFTGHVSFRYRGDGSQSYYVPPRFPAKLKDFSPDAKLIFMIREQKERLLSLYFYGLNNHLEPDFHRWVERRFMPDMRFFLFEGVLSSYYRLFGDSMRVIDNRALLDSPSEVMGEVFRFLGLRDSAIAPLRSNVSEMRKMNERQRKRALPLLRARSTIMTPVEYFLNMTDQGGRVRTKVPLGRLNPFRGFGRRTSSARSLRGRARAARVEEEIPRDLADSLDEDYASALEFCVSNRLLLGGKGTE